VTPAPAPAVAREIPLRLIDDPALASRSEMNDEKMDALVSSIRDVGIIQPIALVARGERYEVVAGHRRTVAARRVGLPAIPATVYPSDHPALRVIQAHENGRREDVNPVDEAYWFAELLDTECGHDIDRLAGLVGENVNYVDSRLQLLELDDATRDALRVGSIKIGVARELMKVTDPHYRNYYLAHAVKSGATVAVVCGWVIDWKNTHGASHPAPPAPSEEPIVGSGATYDPMRCAICGKSDPRYLPETIPVHQHCRLAILEPMLRAAANGGE